MSNTINPQELMKKTGFSPIPLPVLANCLLNDAERLMLGMLIKFAGEKGKAWPRQQTLAGMLCWDIQKVKRTIRSLKDKKVIEIKTTTQNSPRIYTFLDHEMYETKFNPHIKSEKARTAKLVEQNKVQTGGINTDTTGSINTDTTINIQSSNKQSETKVSLPTPKGVPRSVHQISTKQIKNETLLLLQFWNKQSSLQNHRLVGKRSYLYHEQSKTVQQIDRAIGKLMRGTYYEKHDVPLRLKSKKFSVVEIKTIIQKVATACTPEYSFKPRRLKFTEMIESPYASLGKGNDRFRFKYPLIHYYANDPVPLENARKEKATKYPTTVKEVIRRLTDRDIKGTKFNRVVTQVEKAAAFIEKRANGNAIELKGRLADLIYDSFCEVNKGCTVDQLPLAVYNLERMLTQRGYLHP
jgi:hypothetical protein